MKSMPLSEDAQQKYPARLNFKGTIRVGSHYFNDVSVNPMDYASRINNPVFSALGISIVVQLAFIIDYHQIRLDIL